ncbi:MAG: hypothetical protein QOJ26_1752, partial [Thermoplasmata archaeon]|nr:hypothetical protein [Thermoplasmata archaeon]
FLLVLAASLAGCSGGGDSGGDAQPTLSSTMTSTAPPPPPLPTSDTMHFLDAPHMAPALPDGSTEVATPVTVGNFGQGGQGPNGQGAEWRHSVERPTNVTGGEVNVWIEVKETLFEQPDNPVRPNCSWSLTVEIGSDIDPIEACVQEPAGPINPGTKELVFQLPVSSPIELEANETITVRLERSGFSLSANNAVDALSGSAEHDSGIRLAGLKEPIRKA